jgi:hypothetical protein
LFNRRADQNTDKPNQNQDHQRQKELLHRGKEENAVIDKLSDKQDGRPTESQILMQLERLHQDYGAV